MLRTIILGAAIVGASLILKGAIMALGIETSRALNELRDAIAEEANQSNATDAEVAAAVREHTANVRNIVRDAAPVEPSPEPEPVDTSDDDQ